MSADAEIVRYEAMLFNHGTIQRTDYRGGEINPTTKVQPREKPPKPRPSYRRGLKDTHTLTARTRPIPFDLFIKPKDIVRTNPRTAQKIFETFEDLNRREVQRTRPRLVMTPAVSMDDIEHDEVRDLLVKDIYLSTVQKATAEGVALTKYKTIRAPCPPLPAPANPITLPPLNAPYVSPEWRMDSVTWDKRQLRAFCDCTKEFWLKRTPKCAVCDATAARKAQEKMKEQMKLHS